MIPTAANSDYPKFVADQVLTSDNLNDMFGYLDEQGRLTRTNLLGIGIVCGLEVKTAANGSSITITKGVGITSSGYLVSVPEIKYTKRTTDVFDAVKCEYYSRFVNIATKTQKFDLWELKQEAEETGTTLLNKSFLADGEKIVLMFVELLEENNKNCDPNSCDDKGMQVTVNFRPLLIEKVNVAALINGAGAPANPWLSLPELSLKRFDVTANPVFECVNIFNAYRKILSSAFLKNTESSLTKAYNVLKPLLADEFPVNPFATLSNDFKFLNDGSITAEQLIAMQYYYDLFSDILLAYKEFRKKGIEVIGLCCPDDIFPRHLLLNLALPGESGETSNFRHYFTPSPILCDQRNTVYQLKILFRKLVLLLNKFAVPSVSIKGLNKKADANIRITPSYLSEISFSRKSIPYYYSLGNSKDELLRNWSPEKLLQGNTDRNLSYHGINYNLNDDDIRQPLLYDLEPFNFLRIEGHIGKPYTHVVKNITDLKNKNRLPFELVTLSADASAIATFIQDLGKLLVAGNSNAQTTLQSLMGSSCHFNDLELLYDSIMAELTGKLSNEMKFFYDLRRDAKREPLPAPNSNVPQVPLLVKTDATFRFTKNSIGHEFELFYAIVKNQSFISLQVFFQSFGQSGNTDVMDFVFKAVLYYIEMLYETITAGLSNFNFFDFYTRYYTLILAVRYIKLLNKINSEAFPLSEEENDHLDALLSISADGRMMQLYLEFLRRILQVKVMQQAGYYFISHPGIQHKAGVSMGGTFIIVYHEAEQQQQKTFTAENLAVGVKPSFTLNEKTAGVRTATAVKALRENATAPEHLEKLSADVNEKVLVAKDSIVAGLKKSFNISSSADKTIAAAAVKGTKATPGAAAIKENAAVVGAAAQASATAFVSSASLAAQSKNDDILNYLSDAAAYLKNRKADILDETIEDFTDGIVIADFYLPYICCSDCPPVQMIVTGEKSNQPPVARPGDNVSVQLPVDFVTLDGSSSSDPDGSIKTYLWVKDSGPDATIETPEAAKTQVSKLTQGVYVFKLTVTDDDGATNSATVTVTVITAENLPPVAAPAVNPSIVTLNENNSGSAELIGSDSKDPDGQIVSFEWNLSIGPSGGSVIKDPKKEVTTVNFIQPGEYVFKLTVTDDKGASDTKSAGISVRGRDNQPPIAIATADPSTVILLPTTGSGRSILSGDGSSDPNGDPITFKWTLTAGESTAAVMQTPDSVKTNVLFSKPGNYEFTLTVTDSKGATGTAKITVTVTPPVNQPPVARATATPASLILQPGTTAPQSVLLDGSASIDQENRPLSFAWTLPAGTAGVNILSPSASKTTVQVSAPGSYKFNLTVKDEKGAASSTDIIVVVTQQAASQKVCAPLANVMADFKALASTNSTIFATFTQLYTNFKTIEAFYGRLQSANIVNQPQAKQADFFNAEKIDSLMPTWILNLRVNLLERSDTRLLYLRMLNIHTELVYYISCIQKEDITQADVPMATSLRASSAVLTAIVPLVPNFLANQKAALAELEKLSRAERNRVKTNNEEQTKPSYSQALDLINSTIKSMNV